MIQLDLEEWLRDNPVERNIVTVSRPIDPSEMDDDGGGATAVVMHRIETKSLALDPSKVVHDASADPRVFRQAPDSQEQPAAGTGPEVLTVTGPLIALQPKGSGVRLSRGAQREQHQQQDDGLAEFVNELGLDPKDFGLHEPPAAAEPLVVIPSAPVSMPAPMAHSPADGLERARQAAWRVLTVLPEGCELFVGGEGTGKDAVELAMGLGLLVGKGWAAYRGDGHYRLTPAGRTAFIQGSK